MATNTDRAKRLAEFGTLKPVPRGIGIDKDSHDATSDGQGSEAGGEQGTRPSSSQRHRSERPLPADQVIHIQRKMRRQRKELLAELQPGSSRPWTAEAANAQLALDMEHETDGHHVNAAAGAAAVVGSAADVRFSERSTATASASSSSASRRQVHYKIDRVHRNMVRKQVWLQKFDFLYRQVEAEMKEEKGSATLSSGNSAALNASSANISANGGGAAAAGAAASVNMAGASAIAASFAASANASVNPAAAADVVREMHAPGRSHGPGRPRRASNASELHALAVALRAALTSAGMASGAHGEVQSTGSNVPPATSQHGATPAGGDPSRPVSAGLGKGQSSELPSAAASVAAPNADQSNSSATSAGTLSGRSRGGWSSTGSCANLAVQRSRAGRSVAPSGSQRGAPVRSRGGSRAAWSRAARAGAVTPCSLAVSSTDTPLPRLLCSSASMPCILAADRDLTSIRDEYYEGDELFMHEDILHASNPRLFPLRPGNNKPFPLPSLVVC